MDLSFNNGYFLMDKNEIDIKIINEDIETLNK